MDLDVTSPEQLNRRLFLKQLAVNLSNSERRILFRAQNVRIYMLLLLLILQYDSTSLSDSLFIVYVRPGCS